MTRQAEFFGPGLLLFCRFFGWLLCGFLRGSLFGHLFLRSCLLRRFLSGHFYLLFFRIKQRKFELRLSSYACATGTRTAGDQREREFELPLKVLRDLFLLGHCTRSLIRLSFIRRTRLPLDVWLSFF